MGLWAWTGRLGWSAFHQLHNIRNIRKFLDRDVLQALVHALITSKLDSFNSLYSGLLVSQTKKLQRVQNAAARLVLGIPRCQQWSPLASRWKKGWPLKAWNCLAPLYLSGLLVLYASARRLRSGSHILMVVSQARMHTYGNRLFSVAGPVLWNQLPHYIGQQESMAAFKASLKTHLFNMSYGI